MENIKDFKEGIEIGCKETVNEIIELIQKNSYKNDWMISPKMLIDSIKTILTRK